MTGVAAKLPFMNINPNYSGGEIASRQITPSCTLDIRKPIFDGLFKERKNGFVQIDWRGNIPDQIADTIDFDMDSLPDFYIDINASNQVTKIKSLNRLVGDIGISTPASYGWAVRVNLTKD